MNRLVALLVLPLFAAACSMGTSASSENVDSVASEARDGEQRFRGTYEVPVNDTRLVEVATNPVEVKIRPLSGGRFRLKYDLPTVIAGRDRDVDLVATKTGERTWALLGASGSGTCTESSAGDVVCDELLDGVAMSLPEATAAIDASVSTPAERAARVEVAETFIIDPLGVLRFKR